MDRTPLSTPSDDTRPALTRRRLLAAAAGSTLTATAGCTRQLRSLMTRERPEQVSLSIKTMPADADPYAIRIARYLSDALRIAGIDATISPLAREALYRDVLINQEFDLYVGSYPGAVDPDFLRTLCHSRFSAEPGWQNPFGYVDLDVDDLLDAQRRQSGTRRLATLSEVQHAIVRTQPFTVIAFPDTIRATRSAAFTGWDADPIHTPRGYLTVEATDPTTDSPSTLRMTLGDPRPTKNLNPLAVEFRGRGVVTGLLYDPLGRWFDGVMKPWLAASWRWSDSLTTAGPVATVELRDDLRWHDDTPITADDVAFTYAFLQDTSLGNLDSPVPTPRFRGPSSLVESVETPDDRTARVKFRASSRDVAVRAFAVPVLPRHIWEDKTDIATVAGLNAAGEVTEALVWPNAQPVGSGPLRFEGARADASLTLARNDDHFLARADADLEPGLESTLDSHLVPFRGGFDPDRLTFTVVPSGRVAIELLASGDVHGTASSVTPSEVPQIGRSEVMELHVGQPRSFYHLGFNIRRAPLSNSRFRRGVARLFDKPYLVEEVFDGYAQPAASPLARHEALAPSLAWTGEAPVFPFPGENGKLNVEQARKPFREAGFRYSESGKLLAP